MPRAQANGFALRRDCTSVHSAKLIAGKVDPGKIMMEHAIAGTRGGQSKRDVIICKAKEWPAIQGSDPRFADWEFATFGLSVVAFGPKKLVK